MLKISYAGCLGLSLGISSQFIPEMCAADKNCEKFTKKPLFLWFKVIDVDKIKKPVIAVLLAVIAVQHVCTYLQPCAH